VFLGVGRGEFPKEILNPNPSSNNSSISLPDTNPNPNPDLNPEQKLLSPLGGRCYLVLVEENKPKEILEYARKQGMSAKVSLV
jgi:hypothetical protein